MSRFGWTGSKASVRPAKRRVRLQLEQLEDRSVPAVFTVGAGDTATLIADINTANSNGQSNTINLTASTYDFTSANNNTFGPNALPVITGNITINGNGAVLERDPSLGQSTPFRFFYVSGNQVASPLGSQSTGAATGTLTLENLTLEDGLAQGGSSGTGGGGLGAGGAIFNMGNLTLNGVTLEQNTAQGGSSGTGTSTSGGSLGGSNPTTNGNFGVGGDGSSGLAGGFGGGGGGGGVGGAGGFGAGAGNGSTGGGGAGMGGGVFNMYGTTTLINCTLASNLAAGGQGATKGDGYGAGVFNVDGTVDVVTSTLAGNGTSGQVSSGGAIYNLDLAGNATVTLTDSILANSVSSNDLVNDQNNSTTGSATVNATAPNIVTFISTINGATTNGSPLTSNPLLGVLANYGGPTPTMPLLSGSPALGAGTAGSNVPNTDQRGVARGNVIDLGAYQATPAAAVGTTLSLTSTTPAASSSSPVTLTATVTPASGSTSPAGSVQFMDGSTNLGSVSLSVVNGQAQATLTTSSVKSGDTITATYTSSNGMGGSNGTTTIAAASTSGSGSSGSSGTSGSVTVNITPQTQQWLNAVYQTLLHRPIDSTGLNEWGADLNNGTTATQVVVDIEHTSEYQTQEVQSAWQKLLGGTAPQTAVEYLVGLMQAGVDFRVIEAIIVGTPQFYVQSGGTNEDFLNAIYQDFLNRPVDQASETAWSGLMNAGYTTTQVALGVLTSKEYLNDLVTQDYMTYMGTTPDSNSLGAFVAALANGTMNNDMVVASLLSSPEWMTASATNMMTGVPIG
jgi:hypothetical protein